MTTQKAIIFFLALAMLVSCSKDDSPQGDTYASLSDFHNRLAAPMQTYTIDAGKGGSFTTLQGTVVTIPANALINSANEIVKGNVTINFKDIYKKSEILLSKIVTMDDKKMPLKSGGEFFINATAGNQDLKLARGKTLTVAMPFVNTRGEDTVNKMRPYMGIDSAKNFNGWKQSFSDSINSSVEFYLYIMAGNNLNIRNWYNCDNGSAFAGFKQTSIQLEPSEHMDLNVSDAYLLFSDQSTVISLYDYSNELYYQYAPLGQKCTAIIISIKESQLYADFIPITLKENEKVNFKLSAISTDEFLKKLKALD